MPCTHSSTKGRLRTRGFALIMTLGVILLLAIAALTAAQNATQNLESVSLRLYEKQALRAAEAGLADAIVTLRADFTFTGFTPAWRSLPGNSAFSYRVVATNNISGTAPIIASDGTTVPVGAVYLVSTGRATRDASRTVTAMATRRDTSLFNYALFGDNSVDLGGGAVVDAWDSTQGAYGPSTIVANAGDVGTNAATVAALNLAGGAIVNGDLYIGPGADPALAVSGSSAATGKVYVNSSVTSLPVQTAPVTGAPPYAKVNVGSGQTRTLTPGMYGDLTVNGGTLTLQTGTYVFAASKSSTGSVIVSGNLELAPGAGPVRIYFSGTWDSTSGAVINPSGSAANLVIIGGPTVTSVKLAGGTQAVYGLYAPSADIKISGGTDIFGALVGKSVKVTGNTGIHFDTSLLNLSDLRGTSDWALTALHRG